MGEWRALTGEAAWPGWYAVHEVTLNHETAPGSVGVKGFESPRLHLRSMPTNALPLRAMGGAEGWRAAGRLR
jgi:hypothetical protein